MKSLKLNLSNQNLIVNNKVFPSIIMNKCMNVMCCCTCCMIVMVCCCCCVINTKDMVCKIVSENLKWIKYKTTALFMKYFMRNFMGSTVVFSIA